MTNYIDYVDVEGSFDQVCFIAKTVLGPSAQTKNELKIEGFLGVEYFVRKDAFTRNSDEVHRIYIEDRKFEDQLQKALKKISKKIDPRGSMMYDVYIDGDHCGLMGGDTREEAFTKACKQWHIDITDKEKGRLVLLTEEESQELSKTRFEYRVMTSDEREQMEKSTRELDAEIDAALNERDKDE